MLTLTEEHYIGEGAHRIVYQHPDDPAKCIKIPKPNAVKDPNHCDQRYYELLNKHGKVNTQSLLPQYYGPVNTNKGTGNLYQRIINADGTPAVSLNRYLIEKKLTDKEIAMFIQRISRTLIKYNLRLHDKNPENVLLAKDHKGELKVYVIDGFGSRDIDISMYLSSFSALFSSFKTRRTMKKMLKKVMSMKAESR